MKSKTSIALLASATLSLFTLTDVEAAESGFFLGAGVGSAAIEAVISDGGVVLPEPPPTFDEDDFGWKILGGYNWVLGEMFSLGLEGSYVSLGEPSQDIAGVPVAVETTAWNAYGTAGLDFGVFGVFGKYGVISWDADALIDDLPGSDDGTDPAYGIGARVYLGSFEIRGEYEIFDIDDTEDVTLLTLGVVWRF